MSDAERIERLRAFVAEWVDIMGFCGRCHRRSEDEPNHDPTCKVGYAHRELRRAHEREQRETSPARTEKTK